MSAMCHIPPFWKMAKKERIKERKEERKKEHQAHINPKIPEDDHARI